MYTGIIADVDEWASKRKLVFDPIEGFARSDKKRSDEKLKPVSQRVNGNTLNETLMWNIILGPRTSPYEFQAIQTRG